MQDKRARARGKLRGVSPGATLQTAIRPCFRARGWTGEETKGLDVEEGVIPKPEEGGYP